MAGISELGKMLTGATRVFGLATLTVLAACNSGNGSSTAQGAADPVNSALATNPAPTTAPTAPATPTTSAGPATPSVSTNSAPQISGSPSTVVTAGTAFLFQPLATDANGDTLSFSVENKPSWAAFSIATGMLVGTPAAGDAGTYANIIVRVSDGTSTTALPAFSVDVRATAPVTPVVVRTATLRWTPPTQNTDGSPPTDLAGYYVYEGSSANSLVKAQQIPDSRATSFVFNNLATGTHFFAISAYTANGVESDLSASGSKTIL